MAVLLAAKIQPYTVCSFLGKNQSFKDNEWKPRCPVMLLSEETSVQRRHLLLHGCSSVVAVVTFNHSLTTAPAWAGDESNGQDDKEEGVIGAMKSLFDPNEKIKSGKLLPKGYLKSAREVVKTLRESLKEDSKDIAKFRRTADSAKESIREYLTDWRGQKTVVNEESYGALEKAIRALAGFYSKAGPFAPLPEEIKSEILDDLDRAEEFL